MVSIGEAGKYDSVQEIADQRREFMMGYEGPNSKHSCFSSQNVISNEVVTESAFVPDDEDCDDNGSAADNLSCNSS